MSDIAGKERVLPPGDLQQSVVHHVDSIRYNAKHALAHAQEAMDHAGQLQQRLAQVPNFSRYTRAMELRGASMRDDNDGDESREDDAIVRQATRRNPLGDDGKMKRPPFRPGGRGKGRPFPPRGGRR